MIVLVPFPLSISVPPGTGPGIITGRIGAAGPVTIAGPVAVGTDDGAPFRSPPDGVWAMATQGRNASRRNRIMGVHVVSGASRREGACRAG